MKGFNQKVAERQKLLGHALCVGLDPDLEKIPEKYQQMKGDSANRLSRWMKDVVADTAESATVFKLQMAYYERHGHKGIDMLTHMIAHIRHYHPEIPIFLDGKRGDIDRTQRQYRFAMFDAFGCDATNVSPYMGREPLVDMYDSNYPHRGITTLVYTSNKGAREFQDAIVTEPDTGERMPIWLFAGKLAQKYASEVGIQNLGFVMAAAHDKYGNIFSDHLTRCREMDEGKVPYLMPGFGAQGGYVEASVHAGWAGWGSLMMNSSSGISNAENPREAAQRLAEQIGEAIAKKPTVA